MRKILFASVLLLLFISGCTMFQPPVQQPSGGNKIQETTPTLYEIFSNIPTNNASILFFVNTSNQNASNELYYIFNSVIQIPGGNTISKIKGGQVGYVAYDNGSFAMVTYLTTSMTLKDIAEAFKTFSPMIAEETKKIGDKEVTENYAKQDTDKQNPLCMWKDGNWMKAIYYENKPFLNTWCDFSGGFTCVDYIANKNSELQLKLMQETGETIIVHSIRCGEAPRVMDIEKGYTTLTNPVTISSGSEKWIVGGDSGNTLECTCCAYKEGGPYDDRLDSVVYINYTTQSDTKNSKLTSGLIYTYLKGNKTALECDSIIGQKYDTSNVEKLLRESQSMKEKISPSSNIAGEGFFYIMNISAYTYIFSDNNADYGIVALNYPESIMQAEKNLCYNNSYYGTSTEIIKREGKEICVTEYENSAVYYQYINSTIKLITFERRLGNYSLMVVAFIKGNTEAAKEKAEDTLFGLNFSGEERGWTGGNINIVRSQCTFPAGFTCVTNKLYANTGKIYLEIGQGTGHRINVTGVACTQNTSFATSGKISYDGNNGITVDSGTKATVSNPNDSTKPWLSINCTDASGRPVLSTNVGDQYDGRLYINYTELDTGLTRVVVGSYTTKYET